MKYCPHCDSLLTADIEVYTRPRKSRFESIEILGCENCVNTHWADEFFDEDEIYEMEKNMHYNAIADEHQLQRVGFHFD